MVYLSSQPVKAKTKPELLIARSALESVGNLHTWISFVRHIFPGDNGFFSLCISVKFGGGRFQDLLELKDEGK
jgi:hypothetical protein